MHYLKHFTFTRLVLWFIKKFNVPVFVSNGCWVNLYTLLSSHNVHQILQQKEVAVNIVGAIRSLLYGRRNEVMFPFWNIYFSECILGHDKSSSWFVSIYLNSQFGMFACFHTHWWNPRGNGGVRGTSPTFLEIHLLTPICLLRNVRLKDSFLPHSISFSHHSPQLLMRRILYLYLY